MIVRCDGVVTTPAALHLQAEPCVLGAGDEADLVVDCDTVSRRHAELRLRPEGVVVTDLGSKNGLYYLGQRFTSMTLAPGSTFQLGSVAVTLQLDAQALAESEDPELSSYGDLVGVSPATRKLFAQLVRLEGSQVNVLIEGESGTGKELIARAIHEHSGVRDGPLVVVNCGALDRSLVRSELFGHERGAFTGATQRQLGAFGAADGGSVFLDEIGELPLDVQPVLLRALEVNKITAVGSHVERPVKVRLIAATHRDLAAEVKAGRFREDLFYRIHVVCLEVPPLRARPGDVVVLAERFARHHGARALPPDFLQALSQHHWPGNVRELRNAVEAYVALGCMPTSQQSSTRSIDAGLSEFVSADQSYADQKRELLELFTRAYLTRLLHSTSGNQSEAARRSGLQRTYLAKLLGKLGLRGN
jgi:transcriptional regulator with GAF, ATPase, and Fis domain